LHPPQAVEWIDRPIGDRCLTPVSVSAPIAPYSTAPQPQLHSRCVARACVPTRAQNQGLRSRAAARAPACNLATSNPACRHLAGCCMAGHMFTNQHHPCTAAPAHAHARTHTRTHTHAHAHAHTHAHAHAHTHAHAHARTHTHTLSCRRLPRDRNLVTPHCIHCMFDVTRSLCLAWSWAPWSATARSAGLRDLRSRTAGIIQCVLIDDDKVSWVRIYPPTTP